MRLLQEAGPARYPGVDGGRAEVGRHCFGSLACQKPKQLGSLCTEPASHQPATARPAELGVGVAAVAPGGSLDCKARLQYRAGFAFAFAFARPSPLMKTTIL